MAQILKLGIYLVYLICAVFILLRPKRGFFTDKGDNRIHKALLKIASQGYQAHYHLPAVGVDHGDKELVDAFRILHSAGYIITHKNDEQASKTATDNNTFGKSNEELVRLRRKKNKVVNRNRKTHY